MKNVFILSVTFSSSAYIILYFMNGRQLIYCCKFYFVLLLKLINLLFDYDIIPLVTGSAKDQMYETSTRGSISLYRSPEYPHGFRN